MNWWWNNHPALREDVARVLDYWPDEEVLVIEGRSGRRLDRLLHGAEPTTVEQAFGSFGRWLRAFADGRGTYGQEIQPLLDGQSKLTGNGKLVVNARQLLEGRIEHASKLAHALTEAGLATAKEWADRFDLDAILASASDEEAGGFLHGDAKPENVLVDGEYTVLIDWWATPRIGWPVQDVASFAASLWFRGNAPAARRAWSSFAEHYFMTGCDDRTHRLIDLFGTISCLGVVLHRAGFKGPRKLITRRWCKRNLERLTGPRTTVGPV